MTRVETVVPLTSGNALDVARIGRDAMGTLRSEDFADPRMRSSAIYLFSVVQRKRLGRWSVHRSTLIKR